MMWPVVGIEASMPSAISGSRPIVTNSVVPIANPPSASAVIARPTWRAAGTDGEDVDSAYRVSSGGFTGMTSPAHWIPFRKIYGALVIADRRGRCLDHSGQGGPARSVGRLVSAERRTHVSGTTMGCV